MEEFVQVSGMQRNLISNQILIILLASLESFETTIAFVATLGLEEWEDNTLTFEMGTWESIGTPKTSEFDCRGQNISH
jgi:hypothetical protein